LAGSRLDVTVADAHRGEPSTSSPEAVGARVIEALTAAGADQEIIAAALAEGPDAIARLVARYLAFPGARLYTPREASEKAGVEEDRARTLWRTMGFPEVPEEEKAFTDADVEALQLSIQLLERAGIDRGVALQQTRTMSQAAARVAFANQDVIADFTNETDLVKRAEEAIALAEETLPALDKLLVYMYRRHLAAATEQLILIPGAEGAVKMSVGFADLSRFTSISRELGAKELSALIEGFNAAASDAIVESGGRIIKTIGDEVMFSALDPATAASVSLKLLDVVSPEAGYPELRVGVATGDVVAREGDLFGPTVNLANRLVVVAKPASVLVDGATTDALAADPRFEIKPIPARHLKGLGRVRPYLLRRGTGALDARGGN
jgi:adenylate cyclase